MSDSYIIGPAYMYTHTLTMLNCIHSSISDFDDFIQCNKRGLYKQNFFLCTHRCTPCTCTTAYVYDHIGKYSTTSYVGMTRKEMAANKKDIGPTTLKHACNSTTNTCTKYMYSTYVPKNVRTFCHCLQYYPQ